MLIGYEINAIVSESQNRRITFPALGYVMDLFMSKRRLYYIVNVIKPRQVQRSSLVFVVL